MPGELVDPTAETDVSSLTALQMSQSNPRKLGQIWKRGSGVGFFANYKWKLKLFCIGPGELLSNNKNILYF